MLMSVFSICINNILLCQTCLGRLVRTKLITQLFTFTHVCTIMTPRYQDKHKSYS